MEQQKQECIQQIVALVRQVFRSVYLDSARTGRKFGVSGSQMQVLRNLLIYGSLSSVELSRKMFVTAANMTGIIDRLEDKGVVTRKRKPGDRRVVLISLTESGQELAGSLPDPVEKKLLQGLRNRPYGEMVRIAESMTTLLELVDAEEIEDSPRAVSVKDSPCAGEK